MTGAAGIPKQPLRLSTGSEMVAGIGATSSEEEGPSASQQKRPMSAVMRRAELFLRLCLRVACVRLGANAEAAIEEALSPCVNRVDKYSRVEELLANHPGLGVDGEKTVVVIDPWSPDGHGCRDVQGVRAGLPKASIVVYAQRAEGACVLQALMAGADGYMLHAQKEQDILRAFCEIASGGEFLCPRSLGSLIGLLRGFGSGAGQSHLTPRQREVLACLLAGQSVKATATDLGISTGTVHALRVSLYSKLGVHSSGEAMAKCLGIQ